MSFITAWVRMDADGRIQLPPEVQQALRLKPNAEFEMGVVNDRIELTPVGDAEAVVREEGSLLVVARSGRPFRAVEALKEDREERR